MSIHDIYDCCLSAHAKQAKSHLKRKKTKLRLDIKPENLPVIAPFLWGVKHRKPEKEKTYTLVSEKLIKDVYMFISELIHIPSLLNDTAAIMRKFTKSNGVIIYLVDSATNQIYVCPDFNNYCETNRVAWKIRTGSTIPAYVALTKQVVLVNNMIIAEKFETYDWKDKTVTGVLCVPIVISDGSCYGVIELYRRDGIRYNQRDLQKVIPISRLISITIDNHLACIHLQTKQKLTSYILELAQFYIANPDDLHHLVRDIVLLAKKTFNSERGSFFVFDDKNNVLLDLNCNWQINDVYGNLMHRQQIKIQSNKERGIAGLALETGQLINIRDAYNDYRFNRANDLKSGLITRTVLCIPIYGHNKTLGVLQLLNKRRGCYTANDEQILKLFGDFCSIAIENRHLHEKWLISQKWGETYSEVYFLNVLNIKTPYYAIQIDEKALPPDFFDYSYYSTNIDDITKYACYILRSLNIPDENCTNFIFSARRGYRNNHYHNFIHAFNVLHTVACVISREGVKFNYLERVALFISALCHDIDHRGVSSFFLEITESSLFVLYDESPLENHHFFITMSILSQSSIKSRFSKEEYKILTEYIREMILATDLTQHLQARIIIREMCNDIQKCGDTIWIKNLDNRRYVRNLIMTAGDVSGSAKTFDVNRIIVKSIMQEFFEEGELIKKLGHTPLPVMDIQYIDKVPEFQIQFLEVVCIPCFQLLQIILPETMELLQLAENVRKTWLRLIKIRDSRYYFSFYF